MKTEIEITQEWFEIESLKDASGDYFVNKANRQNKIKAFMDSLDADESRFFANWFCVKELVQVVESPKSSGAEKVKAIRMLSEIWGLLPKPAIR